MASGDWGQWRSKVLQGWEAVEILGCAVVDGGAGSLLSLPPEVLLPLVLGRLSPRELLQSVALVSRAFCLLAHDDFLWKGHYSQRYKMFEFQLDPQQGNEDQDRTTATTTTTYYDTWKAFFASRVVAQLPFHGMHLETRNSDVQLSDDQLTVHLDEDHTGDFNVAVVQANGPLLPFPGIPGGQRVGYFEVSFNNAGPSRLASVGLAIPQYAQHHLGWVKGSFGYHGDDGFRFTNDSHLLYACQGRKYYAGYGDGDVVGCGYNLDKNEIFYTQNGHYLGPAFTLTPEEAAEYRSTVGANDDGGDSGDELLLRPSVGLATAHQDVTFNFGKRPFVFNIDAYILNFQVPEAPPFEATRREPYGRRYLSMFARRDDDADSEEPAG